MQLDNATAPDGKVAARALAIEMGVPVVPGSAAALTSAADAAAAISDVAGLG